MANAGVFKVWNGTGWDEVGAAGSGFDWRNPVPITDTANLSFGGYYIVNVTSADKTLTLPQITSSDYGRMIVVEIAAATTKLITVDGYGTGAGDYIDGAANRVMWASEVAQLVATSSGWTKVGGKSIAMVSYHNRYTAGTETTSQNIGSGSATKVQLNTIYNASPMSVAADSITIKRLGKYSIRCSVGWPSIGTATFSIILYKNTTPLDSYDFCMSAAASNMGNTTFPAFTLNAGDNFELYTIQYSGVAKYLYGYNNSVVSMQVQEIPTW
jgi:hypothetical protein